MVVNGGEIKSKKNVKDKAGVCHKGASETDTDNNTKIVIVPLWESVDIFY